MSKKIHFIDKTYFVEDFRGVKFPISIFMIFPNESKPLFLLFKDPGQDKFFKNYRVVVMKKS